MVDHWKPTQLNGYYYIHQTTTNTITNQEETIVCELRNPRIEVTPAPIREAEKLNGTEWRGRVQLASDAARIYAPKGMSGVFGLPPSNTWSKWASQLSLADCEKINGKWTVRDAMMHNAVLRFKKVEESDLPK